MTLESKTTACNYSFYTDVYMGSQLSEKEFAHRVRQAADMLDKFCRVYGVTEAGPDSRDMALCAMAECISRYYRSQGVSSASVGGVSVHYAEGGSLSRQLYEQARIYLDFRRGVV